MATGLAALAGLQLGGCPAGDAGGTPAVQARIGYSMLAGSAPLTVALSGTASSSTVAGDLAYAWDLGDGTLSDQPTLTHTYTQPGRYRVVLTVRDTAGNDATDAVDVRAAGANPTAVIGVDVTSGQTPLIVQFDGTGSSAADDTILDYFWEFGDGGTSRSARPLYTYNFGGTFTAQLTVVTAGGAEASATTTITVQGRNGSLQFSGANFATLPLGATAQNLNALTLELYAKADPDGGTVVSAGGGALTIELRPATNVIRVQLNGAVVEGTATGLAGSWRHIAVTYDSTAGRVTVYHNGAALNGGNAMASVSADVLAAGNGFRGKLAEVRFWRKLRTATEIQQSTGSRLSGSEPDLLGYWPMHDGAGQRVNNLVVTGTDGTLGTSSAVEASDPSWSTEGPPVD